MRRWEQNCLVRIMVALERIADRLELLTVESTSEAPPDPVPCSHPPEMRLPLGQSTGWQCQQCQHLEPPT